MILIIESNVYKFFVDEVNVGNIEVDIKHGKIFVISVYVKPKYRGNKFAKKMMDLLLESAHEQNLKIIPVCSYAIAYMKGKENEKNT